MFEFDFFKLIIVAMIGLLVLGPEKLPGLAAKIGRWAGRARSIARQFRTQLEQEVLLEEAQKQTIRNRSAPSAPPGPAEQSNPSPVATHEPNPASLVQSGEPQKTNDHTSQTSDPSDPAVNSHAARTHD